jgi:uncharacterized protein
MKTEPRRSERTMKSAEEIERLLVRMPVGCLAVTTEDGPYAVAMNYLFHDGNIYVHSAMAGRKIEALKCDSRACFLVYEDGPQVTWEKGCGISQIYKSVICFGKAFFVEDLDEKKLMLEKMIQKYAPEESAFPQINNENLGKTAVIKIIVESMSGKANELTSAHAVVQCRLSRSEEV